MQIVSLGVNLHEMKKKKNVFFEKLDNCFKMPSAKHMLSMKTYHPTWAPSNLFMTVPRHCSTSNLVCPDKNPML